MYKVSLILCCVMMASVFGEPPVGGRHSNLYGAPPKHRALSKFAPGSSEVYDEGSSEYFAPDAQYGAPPSHHGGTSHGLAFNKYNHPASQYGVPSDEEPANYEFEYKVDEPESALRFGHQETRQGDQAVGSYYVLLPDGRTQFVEYQADQGGYRPKITYQQAQQGYGRGPQAGYLR